MDAGFFDVLHDATNIKAVPVVEGVDVDLDGVIEEPVNQQWMVRPDDALVLDPIEVIDKRALFVNDLHAAPAEHERRSHEHRVTDASGDLDGPIEIGSRAVSGC